MGRRCTSTQVAVEFSIVMDRASFANLGTWLMRLVLASQSSWMGSHVQGQRSQSSLTDSHDQGRRSQSSWMDSHVRSSWMDSHGQSSWTETCQLWVVAAQHGMDAVLTAGLARWMRTVPTARRYGRRHLVTIASAKIWACL